MFRIDPSKATLEHYRLWRAHYYANITLIDEGIGKIISALESTNALDDTLIIFTSDHGDALGDHGLAFKSFFYDPMVHVPLILRGPGVPQNKRCPSLVSTLDLIPLFYHTCETKPPSTLQGEDISVLLQDPNARIRETAFSEIANRIMVQTDKYKYAHYKDGSAELYNLKTDPNETTNLAKNPEQIETIHHLQSILLEHWMDNQTYQYKAVNVPPHPLRVALEEEYKKTRTV